MLRLVSGSRAASVSSNVAGSLTRPATRTPAHQAAATNNPQPIAHHPHCSNVSQPFFRSHSHSVMAAWGWYWQQCWTRNPGNIFATFCNKKATIRNICATACSILHHFASCCNALLHFATICNNLQHFATVCNSLQHFATFCITFATPCNNFATVCSIWEHFATVWKRKCCVFLGGMAQAGELNRRSTPRARPREGD